MRDTLFPLDQSLKIRDCLQQGQRDVRLLGMQAGHILPPPAQAWSGLPPFNNEPVLHCGERAINYYQAIVAWYEEKLRGRPGVAASVPELCVSLNLDQGLALNALPSAGKRVALPLTEVRPLTSGLLSPSQFVPLRSIEQPSALLGSTRLTLQGSNERAQVFAAMAVQRADGRIETLNEQVTPLGQRSELQLTSVSAALQPGDVLGLQFSGFSGQYLFNSSWSPRVVSLQGEVELPALLPLSAPLAKR